MAPHEVGWQQGVNTGAGCCATNPLQQMLVALQPVSEVLLAMGKGTAEAPCLPQALCASSSLLQPVDFGLDHALMLMAEEKGPIASESQVRHCRHLCLPSGQLAAQVPAGATSKSAEKVEARAACTALWGVGHCHRAILQL